MRAAALACLAVLLLAGCLSPSPEFAREQAAAAPAATERALGPDGAARSQTISTWVSPADRAPNGVDIETVYHLGDAWTKTVRFTQPGNATVTAAVACTPELLVVRVTDGARLGFADVDAEAANPAAGCRPRPADQAAFQQTVLRLVGDAPLAAGFAAVAGDQSFPTMVLKDAAWQPDGSIRASYDAVEGDQAVPMEAVVRDGRLQRTHAVVQEPDGPREATAAYSYGARDPAPGWRGATTA